MFHVEHQTSNLAEDDEAEGSPLTRIAENLTVLT
jgi:hypothetical protein